MHFVGVSPSWHALAQGLNELSDPILSEHSYLFFGNVCGTLLGTHNELLETYLETVLTVAAVRVRVTYYFLIAIGHRVLP